MDVVLLIVNTLLRCPLIHTHVVDIETLRRQARRLQTFEAHNNLRFLSGFRASVPYFHDMHAVLCWQKRTPRSMPPLGL
jgi:hypothetical protein